MIANAIDRVCYLGAKASVTLFVALAYYFTLSAIAALPQFIWVSLLEW